MRLVVPLLCLALSPTAIAQSTSAIGTGCTDSAGRISVLASAQLPSIGNAAFSLDLSDAPGASTAFGFLSFAQAMPPLNIGSGCNIYLDLVSLSALSAAGVNPLGPNPTTAMGQTSFALPIPNLPSLAGVTVYAQAASLDSLLTLGFVVSNALQIDIN